MKPRQIHLLANLAVGLLVGIVLGLVIWWYTPVAWWLKLLATLLDLYLSAYIAHRVAPRITGPIVDRVWAK